MAVITGGNVIWGGTTLTGSRAAITYVSGVATDAKVAGSSGRTPANGELAEDVVTGNVYERQAGVWVRIDTL